MSNTHKQIVFAIRIPDKNKKVRIIEFGWIGVCIHEKTKGFYNSIVLKTEPISCEVFLKFICSVYVHWSLNDYILNISLAYLYKSSYLFQLFYHFIYNLCCTSDHFRTGGFKQIQFFYLLHILCFRNIVS